MSKIYVGLDGYPKGWVAVWLYEGQAEIEYLPNITALLKRPFNLAMIDMPIGLPDRGVRACDVQAQNYLKPHSSRVFRGARRPMLAFEAYSDYPIANTYLKQLDGKGISKQLFGIGNKLRQLDDVMSPQLQEILMECHPEAVFRRLYGSPVPTKHSPEGLELRRHILQTEGFTNLDLWLENRAAYAKIDDIFDACACVLAARDKNSERLPFGGDLDSKKLRMEIHY